MKRSLKIAFAFAITITVLTMGQPLYAQINQKLSTRVPRTLPAPCCAITAINTSTGVVTAKVNANGNIFQFKVTNAALLNSLKVGQGIYANFTSKQVSLDGNTVCCAIITPPAPTPVQAPAPNPAPPPVANKPATSLSAAPATSPMAVGAIRNAPLPGTPCCNITALNTTTGVVTATENATGKSFQFKVADSALLNSLKVGQGVYANFAAGQVSVDGAVPCCSIVSALAAPSAAPLAAGAIQNKLAPANPCCAITAINTSTGMVTAKVNANGNIFQFKVADAALLNSLKVGQGVFANFAASQVSVDGAVPCCNIVSTAGTSSAASAATAGAPATGQMQNKAVSVPLAATPPLAPAQTPGVPAPQPVSPSSTGTRLSAPGIAVSQAAQQSALKLSDLPSVTAGTPQLVPHGGLQQPPMGPLRSRVNNDVVHLRGADGIQQATNLPEGAKNLLLLHAYTLGPGEVDHYIVNTKLAADWIKAHPALAKVQPPTSHNSHAGCTVTITNPCLGADVQHIEDQTSQQVNDLLNAGQQEWQHVTHELAHDLNMVEGCFADQTLHLNEVPIQIPDSIPELAFHFNKNGGPDLKGTTSNQYGSASGDVTGVVTLGVPMEADFKAQVDMFWIECLPFFIRPKSIHADGAMSVAAKLGANLTANGQFTQLFTIPPTGGPVIPIEVIPIVIAGVPIAELDVSIYLDGTLAVNGTGKFDANLAFETRRTNNEFDFTCSGKSCELNSHALSSKPPATSESVKVNGRVYIKPAFYVALQLDFDVDALSVRAGPQPYLLGEVDGCYAASATQTLGGPSTVDQSYALTSDLDWGIELRAEALVGPKKLAERITPLWPRSHLAFWDLANSTALLPRLDGLTQAPIGTPAVYTIKMPTCYPYPDKVKYQLAWTGNATASLGAPGTTVAGGVSSATLATRNAIQQAGRVKVGGIGTPSPSTGLPPPCNLQSGQGYCEFDPVKDLSLDLAWPTAGNYNLTVTAVGDTPHGRQYNSAQPTTLNVTIGSSASGASTSASNGGTSSAPPSGSGTTSASNGGTSSAPPSGSGTTSASNGGTSSAPPSGSGGTTSAPTGGTLPASQRPCCHITAVDPRGGVATAKVMSTGTSFQFKVTDSATLLNLQLGQGVFANLPARRVSLNGRGSCCDIVSVTPAPASGTGVPIRAGNLLAPSVNPQTAGGIRLDPNPNHLPDLVLDFAPVMLECTIKPGSTCQASCGSITIPTNFGVHNLTQYPANGPIKLILTEIASGATRTWTLNHVDGNQWAFSGGFYTYWKCPTGDSYSTPPDNYTLEIQAPPQLTSNGKSQQIYIPPDAVFCSGNPGLSGCKQ